MIIKNKRIKGFQVFKVKYKQEYLYVHLNHSFINDTLMYECLANMQSGDKLPECHTCCSHDWLYENCTPKSYKKLPKDVQKHVVSYLANTIY